MTGEQSGGLDAGSAIVGALRAIADRLATIESDAVADEPDAVHQLRTTVRRLRSVLAAYEPLFDESVAEALRRRYGAFGKELGIVRDIEVRVNVAERALQEADESMEVTAALRARLVDAELEAYRLAHTRFAARQRMPRAVARGVALTALLDDPPLTSLAAEPAMTVLGDLIEREARRALRRAARVEPSATSEQLHAVRKAGRRLRYVAEAVSDEPVALFDERVQALAAAGENLHDLLGDHRDEVLFAEHVRRSAAHAAHAGEPVDALSRLADAADRRAAARLSGLPEVVDELRRAEADWASR